MISALPHSSPSPDNERHIGCGHGSPAELLACENGALAAEARLLRQLLELGDETAAAASASAREWSERYRLASRTATAWEDLYHAARARRPAVGLLLALTATVAAAGGVLVTIAQFASFLP